MLSLFWRIFLSIWLAMAVTVVASNLANRYLLERERQAIERHVGLHEIGREALQMRGLESRGAMWRFLRAEGERLNLHLMLIERDEGHSRLPRHIRERIQSGWYPSKPAVIDLDDRHQLIAWPRLGSEGWLDPRLFRVVELTLAFILISLACWWIARRVSRPLNHMKQTAEAIAGGDTRLRVDPRIAGRRDEVGRLATAFNTMTDRLCQLLERQNHLLRDISHDLRTPLARQRVAIELVSDAGATPALIESILRQNERLETMTGQILTLYRVSESRNAMDEAPVGLPALVEQVMADASGYARQRGVECRLSTSGDMGAAVVSGDRGLLQRAIDNVLQNAIDHTPGDKTVEVRLRQAGGSVQLDVTDDGPGVDDDILEQLFEPFFRADQSRGGAGWGLGLAIARDIILRHGGTITAVNQPEGGLRLTIVLPGLSGS